MGNRSGVNRFRLMPTDEYAESTATVAVATVAGAFVTVTYTWAADGVAQDGLVLLNSAADSDRVDAVWVDSFHSSPTWLALSGEAGASDQPLVLTGSYPAPTGPDWGWQILLHPDGLISMNNLVPGHEPYRVVELVAD
jgi:hypothetical protein